MPLTEQEEIELLELYETDEREAIAPKMQEWRKPARFKMAYGGRGSGKSWGACSILVQKANSEVIKVLCTREIQKSIEESVYALIQETVERLKYKNWKFTKESIEAPNGSRFVFRGLKDIRAAQQIKSYEGFDYVWVEEAATVSHESWKILVPTFRKEGSEIWATFNREEELDPVYERFCINPRPDSIITEINSHDNPWFPEVLKKEMEEDFKRDPDEADHVWGGQPRKQGDKAIISRTAIRGAMDRNIDADGAIEIGVDVARFGDDSTEMFKRKGLKVIGSKTCRKLDTQEIADIVWDFADKDPSVAIKVDDTGVGGGVSDRLRKLGAKVIMINFNNTAFDSDKYDSVASEMWFTFPIDEADIPSDNELMKQLAGRQYAYDNKGRRKVEAKDIFKKRYGKSPDKADGILLCFYTGKNIVFDNDIRSQMAARRNK
ncbi:MAG: PBSX family phage terminase large subunit [Spirochaetota bacterium]|nr:PBSX family phage terminase large subunit [Spirochaetota bacterium]